MLSAGSTPDKWEMNRMTVMTRSGRRPRAATGSSARALLLIDTERLSASALARRLGVSSVTAKRIVASLRRAGHDIASVRTGRGAAYEVRIGATAGLESDLLFATRITRGETRPEAGKREDAIYDDA